ncbi:MAG TPA: acetyl-CoA carboxylase biotin carboxyl carrier protein [Gemmatimonadaceae bacterium]|nr:acetyl-CoA carboxylase biotin carboxyl carrier protein [Gemmatimonadaceae bacterium]
MIDLRYVKKLIDMIDESTVDSIEITSDKGMKIRISKSPQHRGTVQVAAPVALPPVVPSAPRLSPPQGVPAVSDEAAAPREALLEIKSPMVGTFYAAAEPGAKPYMSVGDRVKNGQIVCIIEAMKIMNEIESEFSGVVREVLVQNAQPVEYGQVLFRVAPNG